MSSLGALALAVVISYNPGGDVSSFAWAVERTNYPIRIEGVCASACTMFLGAKDVCVTPWSRFMFHQAYTGTWPRVRPSKVGTRIAESFYPKEVEAYVHGHIPAPPREWWLSGATLISLGVRQCR